MPSAAGPPSPSDARADNVRALARVLDDLIRIPGTRIRFGLDAILGLIPGAGDVAGAVLTAYPVLTAARMGAPGSVVARMLGNLLIDAAVGAIPLLGDVFDVGWKANRRNAALLERFLEQPGQARTSSRAFVALVVLALVALLVGSVVLAVWVGRLVLGLIR